MNAKQFVISLSCAALFALIVSLPANAALDMQHTSYLTFSGAVALPGVTLPAGTYTFELASPQASSDAVLVRSRDRRHVYYLGLTNKIDRPRADMPPVMLGESAEGVPPPIRVWFPEGGSFGNEFIYR
jgi:hypothetical protein